MHNTKVSGKGIKPSGVRNRPSGAKLRDLSKRIKTRFDFWRKTWWEMLPTFCQMAEALCLSRDWTVLRSSARLFFSLAALVEQVRYSTAPLLPWQPGALRSTCPVSLRNHSWPIMAQAPMEWGKSFPNSWGPIAHKVSLCCQQNISWNPTRGSTSRGKKPERPPASHPSGPSHPAEVLTTPLKQVLRREQPT